MSIRTLFVHLATLLALVVVYLLLGGCAMLGTAQATPPPALPPMPPPPVANGSIWQGATAVALFEDQRARHVGDVLTVLLVERTDAEKSASTSTTKDTSTSIAGPTILGRPVTVHGVPILEAELGSEHAFEGSGDSAQSNKLEGRISVIVTQVLANGSLVIRGDKQLELNQGAETVRIEGIVRPADISPGNTVTSDRVANARIAYSGTGPVAEVNAVGWLARFFGSALWPF